MTGQLINFLQKSMPQNFIVSDLKLIVSWIRCVDPDASIVDYSFKERIRNLKFR